MRVSIGALIISCLFALGLEAQSLADIARYERVRRALLPGSGRLITSEQAALGRGVLSFTTPASNEVNSEGTVADPLGSEVSDSPDIEESAEIQSQLAEIDVQRERIAQLEDQIVAQQLEIARLGDLVTAPVASGRERSEAQVQQAAAQTELEAMRRELAETEALLEELLSAAVSP